MPLDYRHEPPPPREPHAAGEGIRRLVAPNGGPGTYHGTNSYLVEGAEGAYVVDPGPDDAGHVAALAAACPQGIAAIVVTHGHPDHWSAAPALSRLCGAPVAAFTTSAAPEFRADIAIADGERFGPFTAVHTPGHCPDHLCLALEGGVLLSGDTVMAWSSTTVSPPLGDMADYMRSLERLLDRPDRVYLPAHGPALPEPHPYVAGLLARRRQRESDILLAVARASTLDGLVDALYDHVRPQLRPAARRMVHAHLVKLEREGRVGTDGERWAPVAG